MAAKIRLARGGSKKRPYYRIVVADSRSPRDGRFIEEVGTYNPMLAKDAENRVTFKADRIEDWLTKGAEPTERVAVFLAKAGIGKNSSKLKEILKKRDNVIELKKAAIAAKKKAEEEARKQEEAAARKKAKEEAAAEKEAAAAEA